MLNFLTAAFSALLKSCIYASILILFAVLLRQTVLKRAPRSILLFFWAVVLLKLMVPVTFSSPVSIYNKAPVLQNSVLRESSAAAPGEAGPANTVNAADGNISARQSASETPSVLTAQRSNFHPDSIQIASVIWACGAAGMLMTVFAMTAATARRVKKKKPLQNDLLKAYFISAGMPKLRCFTLENIPSPFVTGFFRQALIIPAGFDTGSPELPYILYHELNHIRRHDNLWNLIALLTLSFYWFNPLVWIAYRLSSKDMEIACDESVLRRYGESHKADYAKVLLQLTCDKPASWKEGLVMGIGKPSIKERIKAISRYKKRKTIILISGLVLVLIIAAVFGTGAVSRVSPKNDAPSSAVSDTSSSTGKPSVTTTAAAISAVGDTTATSINITVPPSGKYKVNSKIVAPFQSIAAELLANCRFPVLLPTYLPEPTEDAWTISPEIQNNSFSADIKQGSSDDMAGFYGTLSENISEPPSEQPNEKQFVDGGITPKTIRLSDGITGKEYVQASDVTGGTAITWKSGSWSFFVEADYDNNPDFSAIHYAEQFIKEIKSSGQSLPGSQGKFYFLGLNHPYTQIYWKTDKGIWYELDWNKDPIDAVKVAHSMVNAESK